jgi:uncharacterized protein with PQ loop repeat
MLTETIGWIGNILFAICGIPQVIKTYKTKKVGDLSTLFLWMWLLGEMLTFIYILSGDWGTGHIHFPLYFNYVVNIFMACYLVYAKYTYHKKYPQ